MTITIVLADDHPFVRQGLRVMLDAESDMRVVGQAGSGPDALTLAERLQPDILVLDLMMPGLNGLEVTRQLPARAPHTRVVMLSMHSDEAHVLQALRNGASGYVLKDADESELIQAVREAAAGRRYLTPPLSDRVIDAYVRQTVEDLRDPLQLLTEREREVLHLAAEGMTNAEVAARLHISPRTASTHRTHLMRKLDIHSQTELVRYAIEHGLMPASRHSPPPTG